MKIDELIANAIPILRNTGIVKKDEKTDEEYILRSFRGQISSFGAAVEMGSLLSAVAFFSKKGGSDTDRQLLMRAIYLLIINDTETKIDAKSEQSELLLFVIEHRNEPELKKNIIDAAVALKLAMNAYELKDKDDKPKVEESKDDNEES
ncbi:MAG: hypothetical protein IJN43_03520 [Ruminococcus sp.]|nr:hypothetical protein [Ruminococcus sp.]